MSESEVRIGSAPQDTVLPAAPSEWSAALEAALASTSAPAPALARRAVAEVVASHPRFLEGWATLAELAEDPVESYAYARVGYHRGLDALRAAGWRGSGYVRWRHLSNGGFLRSLRALQIAAERIGELDEADRCRIFLAQLDPGATPPG